MQTRESKCIIDTVTEGFNRRAARVKMRTDSPLMRKM